MMRVGALALAAGMALVLAGCSKEDEAKVLPAQAAENTGGAGEAGQDDGAPMTDSDGHTVPGSLQQRGTVTGTVRSVGPSHVVVDDADGHRFWLRISSQTEVTKDGKPASALAFRTGVPLQAWFRNDNDAFRATRIDVTPPETAAQAPKLTPAPE